jgi:Raf kinase inhibitor-like YbhB/YbcL family protein
MATLVNISTLKIESPAFKSEGEIPSKYTCEGQNINPPLTIKNIPSEAKSLALVIDDPDAAGIFTHWVVWNIKPTENIAENSVPGMEGRSSFGVTHYRGPCPPTGTHRYFFKIYALDTMLDLPANANKEDLEKKIKDHIVGKGELIGMYHKSKK